MHDYAGADSFPATVPLIDDSDAPTAANFGATSQALADRTKNLGGHKLTKDGDDTISGTVHVTGVVDVESAGGLVVTATGTAVVEAGGEITVNVGATEQINGTLHLATGSQEVVEGRVTHTGSSVEGVITGGDVDRQGGTETISHVGQLISARAGGVSSSVDGGIQFGASATDFGKLDPPRGKVRAFPAQVLNPSALDSVNWTTSGILGGVVGHQTTQPIQLRFDNPHDGATLLRLDAVILVSSRSGGLPTVMPKIGVFRMHMATGTSAFVPEPLSATPYQAAARPVSGLAVDWYAGGTLQNGVLGYVPDQHMVIDAANYVYWIEIVDENGAGSAAGDGYLAFVPTYGAITDLRFAN